MKGISVVIAIVLILMITVALAAMAYVWFTGVFEGLVGTGGELINQTGEQLRASFRIETAKAVNGRVTVALRNTGGVDISMNNTAVYINDILVVKYTDALPDPLGKGQFTTTPFVVSNTTPVCPGPAVLRVTIPTGHSETSVISCS